MTNGFLLMLGKIVLVAALWVAASWLTQSLIASVAVFFLGIGWIVASA